MTREYRRYRSQLRTLRERDDLLRFWCSCGGAGWTDRVGVFIRHKQRCDPLTLTGYGYMPSYAVNELLEARDAHARGAYSVPSATQPNA